jgi:serine/threonine protein kinase
LYDFGTTEQGRLYYVMELLDGISLQTLVTTFGPLPPSRVIAILRQACKSLEEAHTKKIVHRDLKPSNLMIARSRRSPTSSRCSTLAWRNRLAEPPKRPTSRLRA